MSLPFLNTAPARTSVTRWGALTARHRVCADSMSLNAIATPAAREPGPLVTRWRSLTVAKVDSIGLVVRRWIQRSAGYAERPVMPRASIEVAASQFGGPRAW